VTDAASGGQFQLSEVLPKLDFYIVLRADS
jgi:hypothetical protein